MPNRRAFDLIGNFNFKVEIEGVTQGAFKNVEGLDSETEVVEYQDGEDIVLRKRPGRTKYSNLTLKRGYINTDELWNWRKAVIDGKVERKSGSVILCAIGELGEDRHTAEQLLQLPAKREPLEAKSPPLNLVWATCRLSRLSRLNVV